MKGGFVVRVGCGEVSRFACDVVLEDLGLRD